MRWMHSGHLMGLTPLALAAALLFALAPACTMPACAGDPIPAPVADHSCHGSGADPCDSGGECEPYMMVDDTPDGLPLSQPPLIAIAVLGGLEVGSADLSAPSYLPVSERLVAFDDPLGARLRI